MSPYAAVIQRDDKDNYRILEKMFSTINKEITYYEKEHNISGYTLDLRTSMIKDNQKFLLIEGSKPTLKSTNSIKWAIKNILGSFSGFSQQDCILCGFRDVIGLVPFYYGVKNGLVAFASNKKMLWNIDLEPISLVPGRMINATNQGINVEIITEIPKISIQDISLAKAIKSLNVLLEKSIQKRIKGYSEVALGFSGGIDSILLAYYLRESGITVNLINVGLEESKEFKVAKQAADFLDLTLTVVKHKAQDVETKIDELLWIIEDSNPVKIAIAFPISWVAEVASEIGVKALFIGNGADELFGGYYRYIGKNLEVAASIMYEDVRNSYYTNYDRDYKICSKHDLDLKLPYTDYNLIEFGLSLPVKYRVPQNPNQPRKVILRHLARNLGFPERLVSRRKRAVQYSTGVNKVLLKLAKRNGVRLNELFTDRLNVLKNKCFNNVN